MTNDIAIRDERSAIVMKSGLSHLVSKATADRAQEALAAQKAHSFFKITESNITINTAEIEGIYNREQYDELIRVKQGEWKCGYGKWHMKKDQCRCLDEWRKEQKQREREAADREMNREPTEEERLANIERMAKMRKNLEDRGALAKK